MTGSRPKLLLHVCCGPCATAVIERLAHDYQATLYWFNPNIQPAEEYHRRLEATRKLTADLGLRLLVEEGGEGQFAEVTQGLEDLPEGGERCRRCYELRLRHAMQYAVEQGFTHVATTLTLSPHKAAATINDLGRRLAQEHGLSFLCEDFKAGGGFQRSVELSKQHGLYRQNYCGCLPSQRRR